MLEGNETGNFFIRRFQVLWKLFKESLKTIEFQSLVINIIVHVLLVQLIYTSFLS